VLPAFSEALRTFWHTLRKIRAHLQPEKKNVSHNLKNISVE